MELTNSHTHTNNSDGELSVLDTAKAGITHKIKHLYITDHHIPDNTRWRCLLNVPEYLREIEFARQSTEDICVYKGVELDLVRGYEKWFEEQTRFPFDFVLGAVHTVSPRRIYVAELPKKDSRNLLKEYFAQIRKLALSGLPDSIAHLDLIKLACDENDPYYREEVARTLETIAQSGTAIEINTSATRKGAKEFNPSTWILELAFNLGIPLTIGTDSHLKGDLSYKLQVAYELAKQVGYDSVLRFQNRKPIKIEL